MKFNLLVIASLITIMSFSQEKSKAQIEAEKKATNLVYKGNELLGDENFVDAEMEYRKAISESPNKAVGAYNLAHSYYKKGSFDEALFRSQEAANNAKTKDEKHRAFHNIGNILMQNEQCKEAVEAFKNALRNNSADEETRYNFALAKECAEQQKDGGGEDNKEDKDKEQEKDKEEEEKKQDENKDEGDKDKKDGDKEEDEKGKPKDDKKDDGKGKDNKDKNQKPKPKPGQMSPQQIKNILEAMQNQEQKVQEKINAEKQKGAKVKTEKDW
ncbi:aerotolerance regulator BatC [Winogradskyella sp. A2]|uniref:aerotolerance regulator BatC n=1 Tax=Winogradskyella sp. A2 TaxID=3366944 RepID=UPI00398C7EC6